MIDYSLLRGPQTKRHSSFTYPAYRATLQQADGVRVLAVGATSEGTAVGLALACADAPPDGATLLSVFVTPAYRGQRIATGLLEMLETELARVGIRRVSATYPAGNPTTPALERILQQQSWSPPEPFVYIIHSTASMVAQIPWLSLAGRLPQGMSLFPWQELEAADRESILERKARDDWYPDELGPFFEEETIEPRTSLGLRCQGEVIGWQINHRIRPDVHRFTRTWLRRDLLRSGRSIALMAASIRRYLVTGVPRAVMCVDAQNLPMVEFFHKRIAAFTTQVQQTRWTEKRLGELPSSIR